MASNLDDADLVIKSPPVFGRIVAWLVAAVALGFALYAFLGLYQPLSQAYGKLETEAKQQKESLAKAEKEAGRLRAKLEEAQSAQAKLEAGKTVDQAVVAKLKTALEKSGAEVGAGGTVAVPEKLLFKVGEPDVTPRGKRLVKQLGGALKDLGVQVQVKDATGDQPARKLKKAYATSWELSAARAAGVARALHEDGGLELGRLTAVGSAGTGGKGGGAVELVLTPAGSEAAPPRAEAAPTADKVAPAAKPDKADKKAAHKRRRGKHRRR